MNIWNQETILGIGRSYWECRVLLTAAELDLFTLLEPAPSSAGEVAKTLDANLRGVTILLDALAAMELLVKNQNKYQCEPSAASFLSANSPQSVLAMLHHYANLWHRWSGLTSLVGESASTKKSSEDMTRAFIGAMHAVGGPQAAKIVALVNPGSARKLLDVGGGSGIYTQAFLKAAPEMQATLFDRPEVIAIAREKLKEAGVLDQVTLVEGDFYQDPLPTGHDLVLASAIIHQNSPEQNVALYRKIYQALNSGGRIIVRDHILDPGRTKPRAGALFAVNMLIGTTGGNCYTFKEIKEGLKQAGFTRIALLNPDTRMDGLVEAYRP